MSKAPAGRPAAAGRPRRRGPPRWRARCRQVGRGRQGGLRCARRAAERQGEGDGGRRRRASSRMMGVGAAHAEGVDRRLHAEAAAGRPTGCSSVRRRTGRRRFRCRRSRSGARPNRRVRCQHGLDKALAVAPRWPMLVLTEPRAQKLRRSVPSLKARRAQGLRSGRRPGCRCHCALDISDRCRLHLGGEQGGVHHPGLALPTPGAEADLREPSMVIAGLHHGGDVAVSSAHRAGLAERRSHAAAGHVPAPWRRRRTPRRRDDVPGHVAGARSLTRGC